jgi:hypothetical protein
MKSLALHFTFGRPCDKVFSLLETALHGAGLRVERTFDLRGALASSDRPSGIERQYTVLLVYGTHERPVTLVVYGDQNRSRAEIINNPQQKADADLQASISQTLRRLALNSLAEPTEEYP